MIFDNCFLYKFQDSIIHIFYHCVKDWDYNHVRSVENVNPNITVTAIPLYISDPSPIPSDNGSIPSTVVIVVIRIGLSLVLHDSITASCLSLPLSLVILIKSINTMALFTTTPARSMTSYHNHYIYRLIQ